MLWGRTNPGLDPEPSLVNSKSFTDVWWWIPRVSSVEWVSLCQYCVSMLCWRCHSPWGGHSLWCQEAAGASLAFNQLLQLTGHLPPREISFQDSWQKISWYFYVLTLSGQRRPSWSPRPIGHSRNPSKYHFEVWFLIRKVSKHRYSPSQVWWYTPIVPALGRWGHV